MKISEINEISEIKSGIGNNGQVGSAEFEDFDLGFKNIGISPVNSKCVKEQKKEAADVYNFVNLSKDDAEEIIDLLKDYVTL
jgi:hypothetical protein